MKARGRERERERERGREGGREGGRERERERRNQEQDARLGKGARARQAGHRPTGAAPATGLPGAEGAPLGAHESTTKGRLSPADSDRLPPRDHAGSQSDGAAARRIGAGDGRREDRECGRQARGPLPHEAIPGRNLPLSEPLAATPTRRPRRIDSDRRLAPDQSSASSQRPPARLAAGNGDSQGCRTQEARVQPTAAAPQGHPGAGRMTGCGPRGRKQPLILMGCSDENV